MTRWTLKFVPSEWNPSLNRLKPYWEKNKLFLNNAICAQMTERYISIDFDPDIFVIDGSVRPENIIRVDQYCRTSNKTRLVIIDNMESLSRITKDRFDGFTQLDFHEYDLDKIPKHQRGKWCTSVFVRELNHD